MGRFFRFIFQLVMAVVLLFILSVVAVIFDGLNDQASKADVALVVGSAALGKGGADPVLDRVVDMQRTGEITSVIVIGSTWHGVGVEDADSMAKYLEAHGMPAGDIIKSNHGGTLQQTSRLAAMILKSHGFSDVMIVADYYDITGLKIALNHEGVKDVQKIHVGSVQSDDTKRIFTSVVALYQYVGRVYIMPEAEQVKKEAEEGMDKASVSAEHAKEKVNKSLDGLAK